MHRRNFLCLLLAGGAEKRDGTGWKDAPALVQKLEVTETSPVASVLVLRHAE